MKRRKNTFFGIAMIAVLGLSACALTKEETTETTPPTQAKTIAFKEIGKNNLYGAGSEGLGESTMEIVQTQEEWDTLRAKMNKNNLAQKEVTIDFEKNTVLAYFDAIRGTGGHSAEIISITESEKGLVATIKHTKPNGPAIDILTQPFHIVSIPKTDKSVRLIDLTE